MAHKDGPLYALPTNLLKTTEVAAPVLDFGEEQADKSAVGAKAGPHAGRIPPPKGHGQRRELLADLALHFRAIEERGRHVLRQ